MAASSKEMHGWYRLGYKLSWLLARALFRFEVIGRDKIPSEGGLILAMNHESYLDPPLAGICSRRPIFFLARKTLLEWPVFGPIMPKVNVVPVDQERADMSALKTVIKVVKSGECTIVFPEGSRTLDGNLQPAQPGLGLIIARTRAPVVPMRIFGGFKAFPRGGGCFHLCKIRIVVGDPIHFSDEDLAGGGRDLYQKLSDQVMERIAALKLPEGMKQ